MTERRKQQWPASRKVLERYWRTGKRYREKCELCSNRDSVMYLLNLLCLSAPPRIARTKCMYCNPVFSTSQLTESVTEPIGSTSGSIRCPVPRRKTAITWQRSATRVLHRILARRIIVRLSSTHPKCTVITVHRDWFPENSALLDSAMYATE